MRWLNEGRKIDYRSTSKQTIYKEEKNMEKKEIKKVKSLKSEELEQTSGGAAKGLLSSYSVEEYNDAGVEVIGWGYIYNDGYRLMASGEDINSTMASWAVDFFHHRGRRASSVEEIKKYEKGLL